MRAKIGVHGDRREAGGVRREAREMMQK